MHRVDAKNLEPQRRVLVSPMSIADVDWTSSVIVLSVAPLGVNMATERAAREHAHEQTAHSADSHLRSTYEVIGYHVHATDFALGRFDDFLADDESWAIRHAVVDTSN